MAQQQRGRRQEDSNNNHENEEEVIVTVLYGSETGDSKKAAEHIARQMQECLAPDVLTLIADYDFDDDDDDDYYDDEPPRVRATLQTLDGFLKAGAPWTEHVVIVVSSYDEGEAPQNARSFRRLCDGVLKRKKQEQPCPLGGIRYHLLGLGDSSWDTYLKNPKVMDRALQTLGAERVGPMGEADCDGPSQEEDIRLWTKAMWSRLANSIMKSHHEQLKKKKNRKNRLLAGEQEEEEAEQKKPLLWAEETTKLYKSLVKKRKPKPQSYWDGF